MEKEIVEENVKASNSDLEGIIDDVVTDVIQPSPVADQTHPAVMTAPDGSASDQVSEAPEKRKRGRPRKNESAAPRPKLEGIKQEFTANSALPPVADDGVEPCAQIAVMTVNLCGMALGGEEAKMREEEILLAKQGFIGYFKAKGVQNIPPAIILLGALAPYGLRITTQTKASTKITNFFGRTWYGIKEFFRNRKNARLNSRYDAKRQDNSGAEAGETSL